MKIFISKLLLDRLDKLIINKCLAILYILKFNLQIIYNSVLILFDIFKFRFINHFYAYKYNILLILLNTPQTLQIFGKNLIKY